VGGKEDHVGGADGNKHLPMCRFLFLLWLMLLFICIGILLIVLLLRLLF